MDRQPMRIASTPHASPAMVSCSPTLSVATISAWNRSPRLRYPPRECIRRDAVGRMSVPKFGKYVVLRPLSACQATRQCSETGRYPNG